MAKGKIQSVEDLPGIGPQALEKLASAGYKTLETIAVASPAELMEAAGLGELTAAKAINAAREALEMGYETAAELAEKRKLVGKLTTGSKAVDDLIGGGVESLPYEEEILVIGKDGLERKKIGEVVEESIRLSVNVEQQPNFSSIIARENPLGLKAPAFNDSYTYSNKQITAFVKHRRTEKLLDIKISRGHSVSVTEGHSLFGLKGMEVVPIKAADLKKGEFIALPAKINFESDIDEINVIEAITSKIPKEHEGLLGNIFAKTPGYVSWVYKNYYEELVKSIKKEGLPERMVFDWKYEKILPMSVMRNLPKAAYDTPKLKEFDVKIGADKTMNSIFALNEETMWLLGFMFAEAGLSMKRPEVNISQEVGNIQALQKTAQIIKSESNVEMPMFDSIRENSTQKKLVSGNTALWAFLKTVGLCEYCHDKKIPGFFFGLKKEKITAFLKGYFEGDGVTKRNTVGWCTSSEEMAKDIRLMLALVGETPVTTQSHNKNPKYKTMHVVFAFKLKNIDELGKNVELRKKQNTIPIASEILELIRKNKLTFKLKKYYYQALLNKPTIETVQKFLTEFKKYAGGSPRASDMEKLSNSEFTFERICDVEERAEQPEFVYDIQTLDNPVIDNFVTGNLVAVHNTQSITEVYGKFASGKCVSKGTNIFYFNPDKPHVKPIEEIYEKYALNEKPFDGGYIAELKNPIDVIGVDEFGRPRKASASKFFREYCKNLVVIEMERGAKLELTENHPLLTTHNGKIAWKSSGLLKEGHFVGIPEKIDFDDEKTLQMKKVLEATINWEKITSIKEKEYSDWVYDLVVPGPHSFIGGNKPVFLHNTQWCFQTAVTVQEPKEKGGLDGNCLYIDSENSFRPERVESIAKARGLDPEAVMKNIYVGRAYNADHQMLLAEKAADMVKEKNIKLIIVDSLTSQFRSEFIGRGTLAERQQKLNSHMRTLAKLAETNNIAVLVTNQVMERPDIMFGDPTAPIGGNIVGHNCLRGDTLIQMADGSIKELKDLAAREKLISADLNGLLNGMEDTCSFKSRQDGISTAIEIDTGHRIVASPGHKFFMLENFGIKEIKASELRKGDYIVHARKIAARAEMQRIPAQQFSEVAIVNKQGAELVKGFLRNNNISMKHQIELLDITPRQLRRVLNQEYPTAKGNFMALVEKGADQQLREEVKSISTHKHKQLVSQEYFTEEMAQITGYFLGDGNAENRSVRLTDARVEVLEHYRTMFKKNFNAEGHISKVKSKNTYRLTVNSSELAKLFRGLKNNGIELASKSPDRIVSAFIRGFVDAEGSVNKSLRRVTIAQKDIKVLQKIQIFLKRFCINSRIRECINRKTMATMPVLELFSTDVVKFWQSIGPLTSSHKQALLTRWAETFDYKKAKAVTPIKRIDLIRIAREEFGTSYKLITAKGWEHATLQELEKISLALSQKPQVSEKNQKAAEFIKNLLNKDIMFEKVRRIREIGNVEPLYDISVLNNENYIANGIVVHNSKTRLYLRKSKEDKRVAKLVDSPHLPDGEAVYRVTENGIEDVDE